MLILSTSFVLLFCGSQLGRATPTSSFQQLAPRAATNACGQASQAIIEYTQFLIAENRLIDPVQIDPELAYQCLTSVPIYTEPALALIRSLLGWVELQSHLDILKRAPQGYLFESVDLRKELSKIYDRVKNGQYYSEYDFQIDIQSLFIQASEGHLDFVGELQGIFSFRRPFGIVNISPDGKTIPEIYVRDDIYQVTADSISLKNNSLISAIKTINNIEVTVFLGAESYTSRNQDPDACWNALFDNLYLMSLEDGGLFRTPVFYPGIMTVVEFVNGTVVPYLTEARVLNALMNVTTGDDVYQKLCMHQEQTAESEDSDDSQSSEGPHGSEQATPTNAMSSESNATAQATPLMELPLYPPPEVFDESGIVTGYFLNHPYEDTAVLAITAFEPGSSNASAGNWAASFQSAVEKFLALADQHSKSNLIVDLQNNGGGNIDLSIDTYAQLFPNDPPNAKHNMRASAGMEIIMEGAADYVIEKSDLNSSRLDTEEIDADGGARPFAWQNVMTPDVVSFKSVQDYYGPNKIANAEFTLFFQDNYTNAEASQAGMPAITITGTNSRIGFPQYFDSKNIIMLHDGGCASACTIFSEYMKNHGRVQSIAVGGRPQTGPMQGVGATKGSQVFMDDNLQNIMIFYDRGTNLGSIDAEKIARGTAFESWDPSIAVARSMKTLRVNARNHYRIDDKTQTALQFVYEASDCRIWFTPELIADITLIWERVADIAFRGPAGGVFNSEYCVQGSTGHPTSLSGGLKKGEIGNQAPPVNAKPTVKGWLINGTTISEHGPARYASPGNGQNVIDGAPLDKTALKTFVDICVEREEELENYWLLSMMCDAVSVGDKWL